MSSFFASFFILGLFTSITEIMVGLNAYLNNTPEIFLGNLIGSSVVIYLLVIPLLAILGRNIYLNHSVSLHNIILSGVVVGLPAFFTLDDSFSNLDAAICILVYGAFLINLKFSQPTTNKTKIKSYY